METNPMKIQQDDRVQMSFYYAGFPAIENSRKSSFLTIPD